jgi:CheY-like chemotaxis protein
VKNAIEACPAGGLVSVRLEGDEQHVRLLVRDTGEGLDPQARERLFERYYTTKQTGTGLGLALVRDAARATGAEVEVESDLGRGALFRVIFPRLAAPSLRDAHHVECGGGSDRPPQGLQARVLVVDDDHALREMLATALSLRGADVVSVRSAEEALRIEEPFDIALIDMMLDGCRGDELLARLRQRGVVQAAMLVTGTVQRPRLVTGGEPDDWVRKPFEIPQLVERIRRTLERHRMLHDASTAARMGA